MHKKIISIIFLLSILLCGCQNGKKNEEKPFEEYEIDVTAEWLYIYDKPNSEKAKQIDILYKQGKYTIVDEEPEIYDGYLIVWGKLKEPEGWIILSQANPEEDTAYSDYYAEQYPEQYTEPSTEIYEEETGFKPYQEEVLCNELYVYDIPSKANGNVLYIIKDRRTITIVEEKTVFEYGNYRTWGRLDTSGWIKLYDLTFIEDPTSERQATTETTENTVSTTKKKKEPSKVTTKPNITTTQKAEPTTLSNDPPKPKVKSTTIKNVVFNYVNQYKYTAETGQVIDYKLNFNITYCEPGKYMTGTDKPVSVYTSTGMYNQSDIGGLYKSAGTGDFAVFAITITGVYTDEFFGYDNILFRKYSPYGAPVASMATPNKTEYEMMSFSQTQGTISKTFYIGFYRSEISQVDFMIFGVGPNGIDSW